MAEKQYMLLEEIRYLRESMHYTSEEMVFDILKVLPYLVEDIEYEREE